MVLKAFCSRHYMTIFDSSRPFISEVDEEEEYMFTAGFNLHHTNSDDKDFDDDINDDADYEPGEVMATVYCTFFDEDKILNDNVDIVVQADMISSDLQGAIYTLTKSRTYKKMIDEDKIFLPLFTCYIDKFYIYPKYRKSGIARYIWDNIENILLHCFNTHIHCFVIIPKPQQPDDEGNWDNSIDENGEMLKRMIKVIKKAGFKQLGKSEYYALNCAAAKK
jgi:hypothetical protein